MKKLLNHLVFRQIHFQHGKKNKEKVFEAYKKGNTKTKRMKSDTYEQVNNAVLKWFTRIRAENVPVSGILIKEKALYFARIC